MVLGQAVGHEQSKDGGLGPQGGELQVPGEGQNPETKDLTHKVTFPPLVYLRLVV